MSTEKTTAQKEQERYISVLKNILASVQVKLEHAKKAQECWRATDERTALFYIESYIARLEEEIWALSKAIEE